MPLQTPMLPSSAGSRFGSRTAVPRLPPLVQGVISGPAPPLAIPPSRPMPVSTSASSSTAFPAYIALYPSQASAIVGSHDILLVDIRSHSVFRTSRIRGAVSLVVPSTLLKRPGYPLEKMAATIDDASARERFEAWQTAKRIVVYDVDTSQLNEGSNVTGLLRKFQLAGFTGELCWIKGGFNAVQQTTPSLVDTAPPEDYVSESDTSASSDVPLRARNLSMYAFQQASTTLAGQRTPKGNQSGMSSVSAANPFYDNIRQNLELSQGVDTRIALRLPQRVIDRRGDLPFQWLRQVVDQAVTDSVGDALAMQFYRIELNEQRRLQEVMDHHSKESATAVVDDPTPKQEFPYSITAGIEMGTKNRYRNIWPFEHARVRLQKASKSGGSDYVNASFVQSLVSRRRYIATQGPLDSTYDDFWSICWEQNVTVIVMLTREVESSLVKCGHYWKDGNYGDISIQLISQQGEDEQVDPKKQQSGAYFNTSTDEPMNDTIIERIFQLRHKDHPVVLAS
ncbi:SubName: Full=Related to Protein-tyrosine phosphatase, receptor type 1 {ECO:0000313/EMBL:CCA69404.1} [Serendipita indica DSM 11827]|nr:SubName: Full=Related to Protein-tyrosine phosphatase, receptor type 1 {ECO:0000313/EMBL:CCA69404.1} [Serendipita indica DSM 11827]